MSQSKLITILLITLIVSGWGMFLLSESDSKEYKTYLSEAEVYMERGLYQKAIEKYKEVCKLENKESDWTAMLYAYELLYKENEEIYSDYLEDVISAINAYEENSEFLVILGNLCIEDEDYETAYKYLHRAIENGVNEEQVYRVYLEVKYAYELAWTTYLDYQGFLNGYYPVSTGGIWSYIEEDGTSTKITNLEFAGKVGEDTIRVIYDGERTLLIDKNKVIHGMLNFAPSECGIFSENLIAIKDESGFSYYDSFGDKQFGNYYQASSFTDGTAAVQDAEGWKLINNKGEIVSDKTFQDIVLHLDGTHMKEKVMIAKENGKYYFYNKDEKTINSQSFEQCGVITDDKLIAVCKDGKWGFVDMEGKEVISPQYSMAKSFSNGLAAVSNGEKWGFVNKDNELVIDYVFFDADYFNSAGCCMVKTTVQTWQLLDLYIKE